MNPDIKRTKHRAPTTIAMILETETVFPPLEQGLESGQNIERYHTEF